MLSTWYYLRDTNNVPVVTIMLVVNDEGEIARGMAVCSIEDNPKKREGRKYAMEYALDALDGGYDIPLNLSSAVMAVLDTVEQQEEFDIYENRGWYMPELSDFEIDHLMRAARKVNRFYNDFNEIEAAA